MPAYKSRGKCDEVAEKMEDAVDSDTHQPKRDQQEPDKRVGDQRKQGQGPAERQQDTPQQKRDHS